MENKDSKKKIIELDILENDDHTGVEKISLVESPAITINFLAFNETKKEEFVKPSSSETEGDFIGRCMSVLVGDEGKPQDQAYAICKSTWDNTELSKNIDYSFLEKEEVLETLIAMAMEFGIPDDEVKLDKEELASVSSLISGIRDQVDFESTNTIKKGENFYLYKYMGQIRDNSRPFCVAMRRINRYYSYDELQAMSGLAINPGFGPNGASTYDIFSYKGGPWCGHFWGLFRVYRDGRTIRGSYIGPAAPLAGQTPNSMPNGARLNFNKHFFASEDKQVIVSPAVIADFNIIRYDEETQQPYWIRFSKETIARMAEKFMRDQSTWSTNIEHGNQDAKTYIFESWIVEDEKTDKINTVYGFNVPKGSWCVKMKVTDPKVWEMVKTGKLKGLSIEGFFMDSFEMEEIEKGNIQERIHRIIKRD
jgi:hypothetical protein